MNFKQRTHTCGELNLSNENETVTLNGWVSKKRNLGGLLFIDLRDRYGITQIRVVPENKASYDLVESLPGESVISATGKVIKRESINDNIPTGEIEIDVDEIEVLNRSEVTPFVVEEDVKASEDLRLKYRYLDLRRHKLADNIVTRSNVYQASRKFLTDRGFIEIDTPVLMKSTPEGARDYLVPSRVHKGNFYALPQSPQLYKQILMVAGFDKYFQICKCFRDEDLRADRQPEFSQIDLEMSFVKQEDVFELLEGLYKDIWKEVLGFELKTPFRQMTYDEAMAKYGTDKPDLRVKGEMAISDISGIVMDSEFKVFSDVVKDGGIVAGIKLDKPAEQEVTRKIFDALTEYAKDTLGFGGLGYIKFNPGGEITSPIKKFLSADIINAIKEKYSAGEGDTVFILSGEKRKVLEGLGTLRLKLARDFDLIDKSLFEFVIVKDFPLFRYDEETGGYVGEHHMFTQPKDEFVKFLDSDKREEIESIRANCYDVVLNGSEITSGSIRIHESEMQKKVFNITGLTDEQANEKFGFLLEAFKYGAPPHGGAAVGLDRVVAIICGIDYIRDVIPFPKTVNANSLMDNSPSEVAEEQLKDLGIKLIDNK